MASRDEYSNVEIWTLVENGELEKGTIIQDRESNQMIFTGNSFQVYFTDKNEKYVGFCKGDLWSIIDVDESEINIK